MGEGVIGSWVGDTVGSTVGELLVGSLDGGNVVGWKLGDKDEGLVVGGAVGEIDGVAVELVGFIVGAKVVEQAPLMALTFGFTGVAPSSDVFG